MNLKQDYFTRKEKDAILRMSFGELDKLGITSKWAESKQPFSELQTECKNLISDEVFLKDLQAYLEDHLVILSSIEMFFTQISMSSRSEWQNVPDYIQPITARGWFLGRWIPTFLVIDGPIGRFISKGGSPLFELLKREYSKYPLLASARDFLNEDIFRKLRNGFGHWSFGWEVKEGESYIKAYDWNTGSQTTKIHQKQADAFHIIAFALIEVLHDVVISKA